MKRLVILPFVFVLLINASGTYVFFAVRLARIYVQRQLELRSPSSSKHQQFEFTARAFDEALVEDEEIKVSGKMYDIVRVEHLNEKIVVTCIHDEAEDNLFAFLGDVLGKAAKEDQVSHATSSLADQITLWRWNANTHFEFIENNTAYRRNSLSPLIRKIAPPPKHG